MSGRSFYLFISPEKCSQIWKQSWYCTEHEILSYFEILFSCIAFCLLTRYSFIFFPLPDFLLYPNITLFCLWRLGYSADSLHGDKSQQLRDRAMERFRNSNLRILVATDVASRGLDVKVCTISHVVPVSCTVGERLYNQNATVFLILWSCVSLAENSDLCIVTESVTNINGRFL